MPFDGRPAPRENQAEMQERREDEGNQPQQEGQDEEVLLDRQGIGVDRSGDQEAQQPVQGAHDEKEQGPVIRGTLPEDESPDAQENQAGQGIEADIEQAQPLGQRVLQERFAVHTRSPRRMVKATVSPLRRRPRNSRCRAASPMGIPSMASTRSISRIPACSAGLSGSTRRTVRWKPLVSNEVSKVRPDQPARAAPVHCQRVKTAARPLAIPTSANSRIILRRGSGTTRHRPGQRG